MTLDADSREMMDMLSANMPMATANTDVHAYRAASAGRPVPPSPVMIMQVEDVTIDGPGGALPLRLYRDRAGSEPMPLILFLHGGGFIGGSIATHDDMCRRLARDTGWMVCSVEYRLSPETRFPGALHDAAAALHWAASAAGADHGINPNRIVVLGDSAGGNLAAALCLYARDLGGPALAGQILLYPILDPQRAGASHKENATGKFLTAEACGWYWKHYADPATDLDNPLLAPLCADLACLPPAMIITAGHDPLRDDGAAYAQALAKAKVDTVYHCIEGTFHAFFSFGQLDAAKRAMAMIVERLD